MYLVSGSYKLNPRGKGRIDTRNTWHEIVLVAKCRFKVFTKQKTIDACMEGFLSLRSYGFQFGQVGFAGTHAHLSVNTPKRYSMQDTINLLKSRSSKVIFARIPNFRKRYPHGSFWSGYEHHQSIGKDRTQSSNYIRSQTEHHGAFFREVQKSVFDFTQTASGDTACS